VDRPPAGAGGRRIGMSAPDIGLRELELVNEVLRSSVLSIGPMVERFERLIAEYVGVRHAVAVSSGTAGLHACVVAAGIGEGDEVITTPFSFRRVRQLRAVRARDATICGHRS